ncbi:MAG: hypothetical protein FGM58_07225, partial [Acidimicrobiia bacterium]|nr:hypothetical protein [Acidimicrobiia bacterium]
MVRVRTPSATVTPVSPGNHSMMRDGSPTTAHTSSALRWMRAWERSVAIVLRGVTGGCRGPDRTGTGPPAIVLPSSSMTGGVRARGRRLAHVVIDRLWETVRRLGAIDAASPTARRYGSFGDGSYIAFPRGDCTNAHAIHIGRGCFVGAGTTLAVGMPTEVYPADCAPVIEIGDRTTVGKDCWFVARHSIVLEHDVTVAPNVYFTDHNHTYADPWLPVGQQVLQGDEVRVGAGTWIATNVVVL